MRTKLTSMVTWRVWGHRDSTWCRQKTSTYSYTMPYSKPSKLVRENPYLRFSDNQYWFRTISEKFIVLVLIQKDFRFNCEGISEFLWIRAKLRENVQHYSESEDNSDWTTESALIQTNSVQNVTWIRLWLSTEFDFEIGTGKELQL